MIAMGHHGEPGWTLVVVHSAMDRIPRVITGLRMFPGTQLRFQLPLLTNWCERVDRVRKLRQLQLKLFD
jgi:hypothetical protein